MANMKKCAFAVCAHGSRYSAYKNNLVFELGKYVPDADIVDIDLSNASKLLPNINNVNVSIFARLAIPLIDELRSYDRVVWIDADTDIISKEFASIIDDNIVPTSDDGLAAAQDINQGMMKSNLRRQVSSYKKDVYFNSGVLVMDLKKIDKEQWNNRLINAIEEYNKIRFRWPDQDLLNAYFDISEIDNRFNWIWRKGVDPLKGAYLVHYTDHDGHNRLDSILKSRKSFNFDQRTWKDRCVVVSLRHSFIKSWIRAYFATGNTTPLVIVPGPKDDWKEGDMEYCTKAAEYSGGIVFDCSNEWEESKNLADRAVLKSRIGWYAKRCILHAVASRLSPKTWAWIDDDVEIIGNIEECFDYAERSPGFVLTQFYFPGEIDNRHPDKAYKSNIDKDYKITWNSFMFFHGEANIAISEDLVGDFKVEDDEIIFYHLYKTKKRWNDAFLDFSIREWQLICKRPSEIPSSWFGKAIHYACYENGGIIKRLWAEKSSRLPNAPFEIENHVDVKCNDDPIDAVFVIGTGSKNNNEELRYALRNIEKHCKFIRDVYICGYCPNWVDRSRVKYIPWDDRFQHAKDSNIIDKLRRACEQKGISKRILFCSDDQFQTRECCWDDFKPRYLRRYQSNDLWYDMKDRAWHTRLMLTMEKDVRRRQSLGLEANNVFYYQPHMWMQIDRDKFIEYAKWCGYDTRSDTIIASGYYNYADIKGVPNFDHVFLRSDEYDIPDATHVAYHDGSYDAAMVILHKLFGKKCNFEL